MAEIGPEIPPLLEGGINEPIWKVLLITNTPAQGISCRFSQGKFPPHFAKKYIEMELGYRR